MVIAVAAFAVGCSRKASPNVRVDPALATLLPSDTLVLIGVRAEALRETPVYKKYGAQIEAQMGELAKGTGVDPRRDLWELLAAMDGKDAIVFARGKFSDMGLEPKLEAQGAKRFAHRGYTLMGTDERSVAFINPTTIAAGRTAGLRSMLDSKDQPKGGNVPALIEKARQIPAGSQIWIAGIGGGVRTLLVPPSSNLDNLNRMVQSVSDFRGGIELNTGAKAYLEAVCVSEAAAKQIHDGLRAIIGMGRLMTPDGGREMLRVYDAIKVSWDRNTVRVNGDFPEDVLDTLVSLTEGKKPSTSSPESRRPD